MVAIRRGDDAEPTWRRFTLVDAFVLMTAAGVSAALVGDEVRGLLSFVPRAAVGPLFGWAALALFQASWFAAPVLLGLQFKFRARNVGLAAGEFCWLMQSSSVIAMWVFSCLPDRIQVVGALVAALSCGAFLVCIVRGCVLLAAMCLWKYRPDSWTDFLGVVTTGLTLPAMIAFFQVSASA